MINRSLSRTVLFTALGVAALVAKTHLEQSSALPKFARSSFPEPDGTFHAAALSRYSFGMDNFIAGLIWIDLLQRAKVDPVPPNHVSWEYTRLDTLTTLDHNFEQAFHFGAAFLSVFRQDKLGAKKILQKWVNYRPNHWRAHYYLGYHLYFELGDYSDAARHVLKAASLDGAPSWLNSLGIRLLSETGGYLSALKLSLELYGSLREETGRARLLNRIRSLKYHLEKTNWESALSAYRKERGREPAASAELHPRILEHNRDLASLLPTEVPGEEVAAVLAEDFGFRYDSVSRSIRADRPIENADVRLTGIHRPPASSQGKP